MRGRDKDFFSLPSRERRTAAIATINHPVMFRHAICHTRERRLIGSFHIVKSLSLIDSTPPFVLLVESRTDLSPVNAVA